MQGGQRVFIFISLSDANPLFLPLAKTAPAGPAPTGVHSGPELPSESPWWGKERSKGAPGGATYFNYINFSLRL